MEFDQKTIARLMAEVTRLRDTIKRERQEREETLDALTKALKELTTQFYKELQVITFKIRLTFICFIEGAGR